MPEGANGQQALSLPQGGGAISGVGETFQADLFSGTGNFSIPIFTSPGRGLTTGLNLSYSSGSGSGPFGLGWQVSIPAITRKTEKGLPRYTEQDSFVMSGTEDLGPVFPPEPPVIRGGFTITRYRPRTEGQFARIERWVRVDGDTHWRVTTPDNITSVYGRTPDARLADPDDPRHVYEWLLQETFDNKGNHALYEYAREDAAAVPTSLHERNRRYNQLYIRRIFYGNSHEAVGPRKRGVDHTIPLAEIERFYSMEVFFDYGDLGNGTPTYSDQQERTTSAWTLRADPFSTYRAGFEIRTLRLCRRVMMFHHFAELGGATRVKSTDFEYSIDPHTQIAFLASVTATSYRRDGSSYRTASLPPVTLNYAQFKPNEQRYQSVAVDGELLPGALGNHQMALVDLFGKGLPDVLETTPGGFRYWRNLGGGHLARPRMMANTPSAITLDEPDVRFADMSGNGRADLLVLNGAVHGFYETDGCGGWKPFKTIPYLPSFDLADPNSRLLDLNGDGLTDVLVTSDRYFVWFESQGEAGFTAPRTIPRIHDLDRFPDVFFDDPSGRVRLADMNGDGLTDIVLVHNGRVDYWPNLGYGRFGKRITMANAPQLGLQADFNPNRLHLADVDGEGCADLVYVDRNCVRFWFNRSGNGWSAENVIRGTPSLTVSAAVEFVDLFGTGTTTLVWSYDSGNQPGGNYKALDFCGGRKPYLLTEMSNNMGATTRVTYTPSTHFYLEDEAKGEPWLTRLPFPMHVLSRVEVFDHISRTKSVTTYRYHHGYYDGREREFRGFGRVDQFDTVTHDAFATGTPAVNGQAHYHVPPVETRTWFHTGIYFDTNDSGNAFDYEDLSARYRQSYHQDDPHAFPLGEHTVEIGASPHEAYRTLRGAILHTEVYSHDGTAQAVHPYQVTDQRYRVRMVQPKNGTQPPVYLNIPVERLSYQYERKPNDPRISHEITLRVDAYGNTTDSVTIHYPRRMPLLPEQAGLKSLYTHTEYINRTDAEAHYIGVPYEIRNYEITGVTQPDPTAPLNASHFSSVITDPGDYWPHHTEPSGAGPQKRLIEWKRNYFRVNAEPDALDAPGNLAHRLPLGQIDTLGLPYDTYDAALTDDHITAVYGTARVTPAVLQEGGYHQEADVPGYWWIPSGRSAFDPNGFYNVVRIQDVFGAFNQTVYDRYDLFAQRTTDPLGSITQLTNDYRTLQPYRLVDMNGNITEVAFDTLGLVVGLAMLGKGQEGDSLASFAADLTPEQLDAVYQSGGDASLLGTATTRYVYDLHAFRRTGRPLFALTLNRETHQADLPAGQMTAVQRRFLYFDGLGREIQTKIAAGDAGWISSGWVIFNNKSSPVQKYEPFFTPTHQFEFGRTIGVSTTLFYDPLNRLIVQVHPNRTYEKMVFDVWSQATWDVNDTVLLDPRTDPDVCGFVTPYLQTIPGWQTWFQTLLPNYDPNNPPATPTREQKAAIQARAHAGTPTVTLFDGMGRPFVTIANNAAASYNTSITMDIEGNRRAVVDPKGRLIARYDFGLAGQEMHKASMEAGEYWTLNNAAGNLLRVWDSRGYVERRTYDALGRLLEVYGTSAGESERLIHRAEYGETQPNAADTNLRGKVYRIFDSAGITTRSQYDFKGNLLRETTQLRANYKLPVSWAPPPPLESAVFTRLVRFDALNRPVQLVRPHTASTPLDVLQFAYNATNQLTHVDVWLQQNTAPNSLLDPTTASLHAVTDIDYNVKGERERITYGNGVVTTYEYDPLTFNLRRVRTLRGTDCLQDLSYVYDPVGNITSIRDDAQQTVFFRNQVVEPHNEYVYDAIYRLIEATGREHLGQTGGQRNAPSPTDRFDLPRLNLEHPSNGEAMGRYRELYQYDSAGNMEMLRHLGTDPSHPGWTRTYAYTEASLLESSKTSNRLSRTAIGSTVATYTYGADGSMAQMPNLPLVRWNDQGRLEATSPQVRTDGGTPEITYYMYDFSGQRVRKVTEHQAAPGETPSRMKERIYLGGFEIYREYDANGVSLERQSLHLMDDTQRIALIETRTQGDDGSPGQIVRYQLGNHLGSASLELDAGGQIISYEEYYPYGSTAYHAVRTDIEVPPKRYRFTGKERDDETGLYYHGARYYAPWIARWISCDPIGIGDGVNLYAYVQNNPVIMIDPGGHASKKKTDKNDGGGKKGKSTGGSKGKEKVERYDTRPHGEFKGTERTGGSNLQSHHPIQQEWGKQNIPGYDANKAPGHLLETGTGQEHTKISEMQKANSPSRPDTSGIDSWTDKSTSRARQEAFEQYRDADLLDESKGGGKALMESDAYNFTIGDQETKTGVVKNANLQEQMGIKKPINDKDLAKLDFDKGFADTPSPSARLGDVKPANTLEIASEKGKKLLQKEGVERLAESSKLKKLLKQGGEVLLKKGGKLIPVIGIAVGVHSTVSEASTGNYAGAFVEAVGTSEIPILSQVADAGSIAAEVTWVAKEIFDPEQKLEQWWYENFLK